MDDEKLTIRDLLDRISEPEVKVPTKIGLSYSPDSDGKCSYWRGRCDAMMHSKASVDSLGEDYFCPHMLIFIKRKRDLSLKKRLVKNVGQLIGKKSSGIYKYRV